MADGGTGTDREPMGAGTRSTLLPGAWGKPLRARKAHYFADGNAHALCGAYATRDVKPSEFGTYATDPRCPTCERKLGYFLKGRDE